MGQSVSERAYQIYIEEGCPEGRHLEHWVRAENEISGNGASSNGSSTKKTKKSSRTTSNGTKSRKSKAKAS